MSTVPPLVDQVARLAGPLAAVSFVGVIATVALYSADDVAMARSPLSLASSVVGLAALAALACAVVSLMARLMPLDAAPRWAPGAAVTALVATVLAAGGQWTLVFVVPGLVDVAPQAAAEGIGSVIVGYVVSFLLLAIGWATLTLAARRAGLLSRGATAALLVGCVLCVAPLPSRWFVLALAVSWVLTRRSPAPMAVTA